MSDTEQPKRPMDDERYRIPGTNMFNLSQWSRENLPKEAPVFQVGDTGFLLTDTEVQRVFEDCDGTPLYGTKYGNGWSTHSFMPLSLLVARLKKWALEDGTEEGLKRLIEWGWDDENEQG